MFIIQEYKTNASRIIVEYYNSMDTSSEKPAMADTNKVMSERTFQEET